MLARFLALLPSFSLGLFLSRVMTEQLASQRLGIFSSNAALVIVGLALTIFLTAISFSTLSKQPRSYTWPLAGLFLYTLSPTQDPRFLWAALALTLLLFLLSQATADRVDEGLWHGNGVLLVLTVIFGIAYGLTVALDILPADNGEFQLRAAQLGVAHPPGFPLYTFAAYLMTKMPIGGTPAFRVNFFGLLCALATVVGVYRVSYRLTRSTLAAFGGAAMLGVGTTFWAQATIANIRSLTALFAVLMFWTAIRWYQSVQAHETDDRWPWLFTLIAVLGVGHHASLIFMGAVIFLFMVWAQPRYWMNFAGWWPRLGAIGLGLLPQLYLFWRGQSGAPGAPAGLDTLTGLFNHITARGFQGDLFHFLSWPDFPDRLRVMADVYLFQWPLALIIASILGWIVLWRQQRPIALLLLITTIVHTLITATYRAPQTVEYMLPAYIPWAIAFAALPGLWPAGYRFTPPDSWQRIVKPLLISALLLLLFGQFSRLYPTYRQIQLDNNTREYVDTILNEAPANAVVLADWHWATPLWYATQIEGARPDIEVRYVFPTAEAYGETWARRIGEEGDRPVVATHFEATPFATLPPPAPIGEAYLFAANTDRLQLPPIEPIRLENELEITNLELPTHPIEPGLTFSVVLESKWPTDAEPSPTTIFIHLIRADGSRLLAQQDIPLRIDLARQQTALTLTPRLEALPGEYIVRLGAYNSLTGMPISMEGQATNTTDLGVLEIVPQSNRPFTQNRTYRHDIANPRILIGYDWDSTIPSDPRLYLHWQIEDGFVTELANEANGMYQLPAWFGPWGLSLDSQLTAEETHYIPFAQGIVWLGPLWQAGNDALPGETVRLAGHWGSNRPVYRDIGVAVRLVGYQQDTELWAWSDLDNRFGVPSMGAIPTLKWVNGSNVYDTHRLTINEDSGLNQRIGVIVGLYNTMTNETVPILDERFGAATPWFTTTISSNE